MRMRAVGSGSVPESPRRGVILVAVLYFLVVGAVLVVAVLSVVRAAARRGAASASGTTLFAVAEERLNAALAAWDGARMSRQPLGTTALISSSSVRGARARLYVTRLGLSVYSIVAEAVDETSAAGRRVNLLVRVPNALPRIRGALVSAVNVTLGPAVRVLTDTATSCGAVATAPLVLAPAVTLATDPAMPSSELPAVIRDPAADDSTSYLRFGDAWWGAMSVAADVHLSSGAHVTPSPTVVGTSCALIDSNWGDVNDAAPCAGRAPTVYAAGDLTIDGGAGQGVLLVEGHLTIAGSFTYSGQIVARRGIETLADNITISGAVYAWRASDSTASHASDVVLTHATTLRYSGCDAQHGIASWLQPRRVHARAWSELF